MLTEEHIKEGLSRAYVTALAHSAGMNCSIREHDYGIDGTFHEIRINKNGRRCENGFRIDFQLKSCINRNVSNDYITYDLEAKNYNDLVDTDIGAPRLLIVFLCRVIPRIG
ncbi:DUF4365 domain-containing protein [Brevibacillus parabrevis]|jgi:hypothetical protein|uniref:DUF4365 domain-containing protein n=1 Tax=Brevibacillus parabrevis TaxID=54914 RepID=UPI003CD0C73C